MTYLPDINNHKFGNLLVPSLDHKELVDDDCGLPEHPIFSNYSKYLWKSHSRNPRINALSRTSADTDGTKKTK